MRYPLAIAIILLAGCASPASPPLATTVDLPSGQLVTVADYQGSLALRFELNGKPGQDCTHRQEWVGRQTTSGIDYFMIREGDPKYTYGGFSQRSGFVQVGDDVDTRSFDGTGDAYHARLTAGTHTLAGSREVIVLVFGNLDRPSSLRGSPSSTLMAGFDCHSPGSVKLLGAGTEVVPILFDRFNSTAAADGPKSVPLASDRFMIEGRLAGAFTSPLVEVRFTTLGGNDVAQLVLTHPTGEEDWSMVFNPGGRSEEFLGGPGTYRLDLTSEQTPTFWGAIMGFDAPEKLDILNVTALPS